MPLILAAGCRPDLGEADLDAAQEVVYDRDGVPAYAGQALVIQSCGAGGFCHSQGIHRADRLGAPAGLDFDLRIASITVEIEDAESFRLLAQRANVMQHAGAIWEEVTAGRMPPGGTAGEQYRASTGLEFERFDASGSPAGALPGLDSAEGREILRNWLATGERLPVVERTQVRLGGEPPIAGDIVPLCERSCVEPSFESIFTQILVPSCGRSRCHDDSEPASDLDLVGVPQLIESRQDLLNRMTSVLTSLEGAEAQGSQCRTARTLMLVPGDPMRSLLYLKVAAASSADVCGSKMPLAGNPLSEQRLCALREWIACGACGPEDRSCDACIAEARVTCGVASPFDPETGVAMCDEVPRCANRPDLSAM